LERSKLSTGTIRFIVGVLLALTASFLSARAFVGTPMSTALPLWFILVLFFLAWRYGFAAGVIGSVVCAFVFAHYLFDPTGSWHVQDAAARRNLFWMVLGAIVMSYLLMPPPSERGSD
jgi:K+-sensing histidine kinase KdpD